jgi:hypothetical protein
LNDVPSPTPCHLFCACNTIKYIKSTYQLIIYTLLLTFGMFDLRNLSKLQNGMPED